MPSTHTAPCHSSCRASRGRANCHTESTLIYAANAGSQFPRCRCLRPFLGHPNTHVCPCSAAVTSTGCRYSPTPSHDHTCARRCHATQPPLRPCRRQATICATNLYYRRRISLCTAHFRLQFMLLLVTLNGARPCRTSMMPYWATGPGSLSLVLPAFTSSLANGFSRTN
jgi:hypothetical protein